MAEEKTLDCLCVRSIDYKDNDKLVTLYAFGEGKITAVLKGVKKAKAKLKFASSLLCFGKYYLAGRNGYYTVTGCDLIDNFFNIWQDIDKYYAALASLEILDKTAEDREVGDKIGAMTLDFLNTICYKTNQTYQYFVKYLFNVVKILGYAFDAGCCSSCGRVDMKESYFSFLKGGIVCDYCNEPSSVKLSESSLKILNLLNKGMNIENYEVLQLYPIISILNEILCRNLAKNFKCIQELLLFIK